ncbi:MAG: serine hydrolase [Flavobacteriales bacterium]|nr:serine hydrolase [Flavobacteriales bacterium]
MNKIFLLSLTILVSFHPLLSQKRDKELEKKLKSLDVLFEQSIIDFNVPGMSIAIVHNDSLVFCNGYGVTNVKSKTPVDENTLFAIASNTKAFTSAALGMLVDEGKISWDDKVRSHLPYFQLYSPFVSEEMTIRDLLCHRSGLATFSGDLIWYGTAKTREDVIRSARFLEPTSGFRTTWGYSNIMFLAAGEVVANVSGLSWDEFMKKKFFDPLVMKNSNTSITQFTKAGNIAIPHNEVEGKNVTIEYVNWDNIGAAGSINSSAHDVAQWLRVQLNKGTYRGTKLWSEARSWEMWENQTPRPVGKWQRENMPSRHWNGYGLGWELMEYGGYKIVSHGGGYDGMISKTVLIPELNIGFVILTNNINSLPGYLTYEILDEFTSVKEKKDWKKIFLEFKKQDEEETAKAQREEEEKRKKDTEPSLLLREYCGTYSSEMYGEVVVKMAVNDAGLVIDFLPTALFKGTLSHWHYDTFQLSWSTQMMLPKGKVTFVLNAAGEVEEMKVDVPNPDFDFTELKLKKQARE